MCLICFPRIRIAERVPTRGACKLLDLKRAECADSDLSCPYAGNAAPSCPGPAGIAILSVDLRRAGRSSRTLMFAATSKLQASAELQRLAELQGLERKFGIVGIENCFSNFARRQRTLRDGFRLRRVDPRIWTCPSAITQPSFGIQHRSNYAGHSASPALSESQCLFP